MIEDKFADEMLSDEELDNVAGGTAQELSEVYNAMAGTRGLSKYLKNSKPGNIDVNEITTILKDKLSLDVQYNPNEANKYIYSHWGKTQNITQNELVAYIKDYDRCEAGVV